MMNAQEIIAYIGSAEKRTPVKVYIKERTPLYYGSAQVFGEGPSKVVFGDWRELSPCRHWLTIKININCN